MGRGESWWQWKSDDIIVCLFARFMMVVYLSMFSILFAEFLQKIKTHHDDVWSHNKRKDKQTHTHPLPHTHNSHPKSTLPRSCYYSTCSLACLKPLYLNPLPSIGSMGFFPPFFIYYYYYFIIINIIIFFLDKKLVLGFLQSRFAL